MKHYLNVCDVNGATVEPVDLITFGSPCQDLSVAGKRAGLKHESNGDEETTRSGLFMEAVRIIKEMREEDEIRQLRSGRSADFIRPRFAVWENVPGAFSSNKGEDFRTVLEELARVKDTEISIPMPDKGKWQPAGEIVGDGWSIAWRTLDAQYHGVPQRRRRIFLVADFADQCAGEILFECKGLPGYPSQSSEKGQGTAGDSSEGTGRTSEGNSIGFKGEPFCYDGSTVTSPTNAQNPKPGDPCHTLGTDSRNYVMVPYTLKIRSGCEGGGKGTLIQTDKSATLAVTQDQTLFQPVAYGICSYASNSMKSGIRYIVRRLTPTECARLQGMPDDWCRLSQIDDMSDEDYEFWKEAHKINAEINGKTYREKTKEQMIKWYNGLQSDAPEYKAYGNGMALPCVRVPIHGIAQHGAKTMASLFDGIGGFPLAGLMDGIQTLWTSEIELFPIAVTMERFREYEQYGCFTFGNKIEKEKKEMELRINEMQLPAPITFNYEELKQEIGSKVSMYTNLVYTDEQIQEAKKDKANLNKLKKALNDERIRMEKEYMMPFNTFKAQVNEIIGIIDEPVAMIDKQVKAYEEKQKQEKKAQIERYWHDHSNDNSAWVQFTAIFNEKWLNASVSMKSIQGEIDARLEQIENDLATLQNLPEFGFEATQIYKSTLDINKALNEGRRLSEIAKAKAAHEAEMKARAEEQARIAAEAEARKQVEEFENDMRVQNEAILKGCEMAAKAPAKQWVTFAAHLTTEDALALKAFFEERNIEFKSV